MKVRSAILFITALVIGTPSQNHTVGGALAATHDPPLIVDKDGCHFSPEINKLLLALPQYSDMGTHSDHRAALFSFENLHGVGVVKDWEAEWSDDRLYFREDFSSLVSGLRRIGLQVDGEGLVTVPKIAEDERGLVVRADANNGDNFADARSYLTCGSF